MEAKSIGGCECGGSDGKEFSQFEVETLNSYRSAAAAAAGDEFQATRLWARGGRVHVARGTDDGKKGCVTIPVLGVPLDLCWEFNELTVNPPAVTVRVKLTISVSGVQYYTALLSINCSEVTNPESCSFTIENELASNNLLTPDCNRRCLQRCAPRCVTCAADYWCWAACSVVCVSRCCSAF
jgi:hypothetical protein